MKKILPISLITALILFSCGMLPQSVEKNGTKIQYKDVTKDEATKLLNYLDENGFTDGRQKDLKLGKAGDGYNVKMVVKKGYHLDDKNIELMTDFACEISKAVFDGKLVTLDLCDDTWGLQKSVMSDKCGDFEMLDKKSRMFGDVELFYGESITEKQQDDVGKYLTDYFGDDVERTFVIDKKDGKGVLSIVVTSKKYYEDPELLDIYRIFACDMTKILGFPTDVHMCDEYMKMQKVVERSNCDE